MTVRAGSIPEGSSPQATLDIPARAPLLDQVFLIGGYRLAETYRTPEIGFGPILVLVMRIFWMGPSRSISVEGLSSD